MTKPTYGLIEWVERSHGDLFRHRHTGEVRRLVAWGKPWGTRSAAFITMRIGADGQLRRSTIQPSTNLERSLRRAWNWVQNAEPIEAFGDAVPYKASRQGVTSGDST